MSTSALAIASSISLSPPILQSMILQRAGRDVTASAFVRMAGTAPPIGRGFTVERRGGFAPASPANLSAVCSKKRRRSKKKLVERLGLDNMRVDAERLYSRDQLRYGWVKCILVALEPKEPSRKAAAFVKSFRERQHDGSVATAIADHSQAGTAARIDQTAPHFYVLLAGVPSQYSSVRSNDSHRVACRRPASGSHRRHDGSSPVPFRSAITKRPVPAKRSAVASSIVRSKLVVQMIRQRSSAISSANA